MGPQKWWPYQSRWNIFQYPSRWINTKAVLVSYLVEYRSSELRSIEPHSRLRGVGLVMSKVLYAVLRYSTVLYRRGRCRHRDTESLVVLVRCHWRVNENELYLFCWYLILLQSTRCCFHSDPLLGTSTGTELSPALWTCMNNYLYPVTHQATSWPSCTRYDSSVTWSFESSHSSHLLATTTTRTTRIGSYDSKSSSRVVSELIVNKTNVWSHLV